MFFNSRRNENDNIHSLENTIDYKIKDRKKNNISIGNFIIGEKLGKGTFGLVRLGTHILTGEKVAIKILEKSKILEEADKNRIEKEIKILKILRHNNIIQLYCVIQTYTTIYLIMEYANGKELYDYIIKNKKLSEIESCKFFQQLINGIEYLNKVGIVHRDLKPENLLLDSKQKTLKIVDFGLSNIYNKNQLLKTSCGSPCYAAPEMINGQFYEGVKVDIWSSGIILFAMLCGFLPFEDDDTEMLYKKITNGNFIIPQFISSQGKDLIKKILNIDPSKRINIQGIKNHPWFNLFEFKINFNEGLLVNHLIIPVDENIISEMGLMGFDKNEVRKYILGNKHNYLTTTYYLIAKIKGRKNESCVSNLESKEFENYCKDKKNLLSNFNYNIEDVIQWYLSKFEDKNENGKNINNKNYDEKKDNINKLNDNKNKLSDDNKKNNKNNIKINEKNNNIDKKKIDKNEFNIIKKLENPLYEKKKLTKSNVFQIKKTNDLKNIITLNNQENNKILKTVSRSNSITIAKDKIKTYYKKKQENIKHKIRVRSNNRTFTDYINKVNFTEEKNNTLITKGNNKTETINITETKEKSDNSILRLSFKKNKLDLNDKKESINEKILSKDTQQIFPLNLFTLNNSNEKKNNHPEKLILNKRKLGYKFFNHTISFEKDYSKNHTSYDEKFQKKLNSISKEKNNKEKIIKVFSKHNNNNGFICQNQKNLKKNEINYLIKKSYHKKFIKKKPCEDKKTVLKKKMKKNSFSPSNDFTFKLMKNIKLKDSFLKQNINSFNQYSKTERDKDINNTNNFVSPKIFEDFSLISRNLIKKNDFDSSKLFSKNILQNMKKRYCTSVTNSINNSLIKYNETMNSSFKNLKKNPKINKDKIHSNTLNTFYTRKKKEDPLTYRNQILHKNLNNNIKNCKIQNLKKSSFTERLSRNNSSLKNKKNNQKNNHFDTICLTFKTISQLKNDIQKVLSQNKIYYTNSKNYMYKFLCEKNNIKFEIEINRSEKIDKSYNVNFIKIQGNNEVYRGIKQQIVSKIV